MLTHQSDEYKPSCVFMSLAK